MLIQVLSLIVEGAWSAWGSWGSCTGQTTHDRVRSFSGGNMPCLGTDTETQPCCQNPQQSISLQQCYEGSCSSHGTNFRGVNALTDTVPETLGSDYWLATWGMTPQKFRIQLSCGATLASVKIRNSFNGCCTPEAYVTDIYSD